MRNKLTIDYVVLSNGEAETESLLQYLRKNKDSRDTLTILYDGSEDSNVSKYNKYGKVVLHKLDYSYSEHRNFVLPLLKSDYSFFVDADERPSKELFQNIKDIIINNDYPDLINVPRINIVKGLTTEYAQKFGYRVTDENIVNWEGGDYQSRLFKNGVGLEWSGKLHERIHPSPLNTTYTLMRLPQNALIHTKTLEKQIKNNENYNSKYSYRENMGLS